MSQRPDQEVAAWTLPSLCGSPGSVAGRDQVAHDASELVAVAGQELGRQAVVDNHDRLFRGMLSGSAMVGEVEWIRYVHPQRRVCPQVIAAVSSVSDQFARPTA
ncbi:MAG: hypothetical protein ACRD0Q_02330 [Acidimicrobiales bacterium]